MVGEADHGTLIPEAQINFFSSCELPHTPRPESPDKSGHGATETHADVGRLRTEVIRRDYLRAIAIPDDRL